MISVSVINLLCSLYKYHVYKYHGTLNQALGDAIIIDFYLAEFYQNFRNMLFYVCELQITQVGLKNVCMVHFMDALICKLGCLYISATFVLTKVYNSN